MFERVSTAEHCDAVIDLICQDIKDKLDVAVIGLSGGADSTLVGSLCVLALGKDNVYGIGMPYGKTDYTKFNHNSANVALKLGIDYKVIPITTPVEAVIAGFGVLSELNQGNLRSRMRMITMYSYNCQIAERNPNKRVRVMGTGNLSEDFIGYDTKGGDALADIFPIAGLYKYEVYALLERLVQRGVLEDSMIDRVPSAGLWEGQTDEGEIGYTYNEMAPYIEFCQKHYDFLNNATELQYCSFFDRYFDAEHAQTLAKFVWKRHIVNRHKHLATYGTDLSELQ